MLGAAFLLHSALLYPAAASPEASFVHIAEAQGLSNTDVRAIEQDQQGFLWFGTAQGGLNRFDGYEIKVFGHDPAQADSLVSNFVWSLLVDHAGVLWVGTASGLDRFDRSRERFVHHGPDPARPSSLPNAEVLSLYEDSGHELWVGTRGGLCRMDRASGEFETFTRPPTVRGSANSNSVRSIVEDPATGLLWVGTSDGLAAFDPRTRCFASFVHDPEDAESLCANPVNAVLIAPDRVFWVLTDRGLASFKPGFDSIPAADWVPPRQVFRRYPGVEFDRETIGGEFLRGGVIDRRGRLWVASERGLNLVDRATGRVRRYRHVPGIAASLADDFVYKVFEDRAGAIWVSTLNAGVSRLRGDNKPFRVYQHSPGDVNSLSSNRISSVDIDPLGRLWVGTARGLNRLDGDRWTRLQVGPGGAADEVSILATDPAGGVWVGTRSTGLWHFDGEAFRSYASPEGNVASVDPVTDFTGHEVNDLRFDRNGRLWIGARAYGLDVFEGGRFRHFGPLVAGDPPRARPMAFPALGYLDADGCYWFGTEAQGLVRLDPDSGEHRVFLPAPESPGAWENRGCYFVEDDGGGGLWVGGASGLRRFERSTGRFVRSYTRADGLPSDMVSSMVRDAAGLLWLGTSGGLARLDPGTGRVRLYDTSDGLPSNVFVIRAGARDEAGRIYFGTKGGVVSFLPDELRDNPLAPPVVFTDLRLLDRVVSPGEDGSPLREAMPVAREIRLSPKQAIFGIGFSALDFTAPEKNSYLFKLDGFDPDWRPSEPSERRASYTNLPPGEYVFRVRAANSDGVWNDVGAAVRVVVQPPWWSRWWFRAIAGLACFGVLAGGILWRERAIRLRNEWLRRRVDSSTEQLRAEVAVREAAEASLRESHAQLENRVQDRTAELARANASLRAEIAERRKVEAQLRQAQKMEAFGQLAGGVAHDFNNLLTVILGQCETLRDPASDAELKDEAVRDVANAARSASNLTRQLLVFSRQQAMNPAALDFNVVVAGVAKMLRRIIGENIELVTQLSPDPLPLNADHAMLEQVLVNMAVNARDAMPRGGRLEIAAERVAIGADHPERPAEVPPGEFVLCRVIDTGAGIQPENLPRIFEPFFTTKESGRGTGLGLATSLGIVQQHGGWIGVSSTPGAGTIFRIHLPCIGGPVRPVPVVARKTYARGSATILLVEDQESVRRVAARMLALQGYTVLQAGDSEEALRLWSQHRDQIALLVTDIVMPGARNGRDLAAMLRADSKELRIMVVTGYDPSLTGGLDDPNQPWDTCLRKPFTRDQLLAGVERLLAR